MATSSNRHVFTEDEILNVVYTLESDDEYSEVRDFEIDNHPSDGDESDSAVTDQPAPQHSRKKIVPVLRYFSGTVVCSIRSCKILITVRQEFRMG
jgi:hypothetical protein